MRLVGKNALHLEASSGDARIGTNLRANGESNDEDLGGSGALGGFDGVIAGELAGKGPGAPLFSSSEGHGAAYGLSLIHI